MTDWLQPMDSGIPATSRSVAFPTPRTRPPSEPHPDMEQRYTKPDNLTSYIDVAGVQPGEIVRGGIVDDIDANGYRRSQMVVQVECDNVPHPVVLYLHVLPSADGVNFSDPHDNSAIFTLYMRPRSAEDPSAFYVLDGVPASPLPFRLAIEYWGTENVTNEPLGPLGISYSFYTTVDVPI